jgi:asparagine synthase (glutamine-hydrolysing)
MSIIFGLLKERGARAAGSEVLHLAVATERYATGVSSVYTSGRLGMGLQQYFSHQRSAMEKRPAEDPYGHALCFDGRLDNYRELGELLGLGNSQVPDSQIVLSAFARWGEGCFSHFLGDWALVLWSEKDQSLYLARDHAGTRTLYFRHDHNKVLWSTHLDTFSLGSSELRLAEDYVACYLASHPIRDLTPYEGVRSVPPAHYLVIRNNAISRHSHWTSTVTSTIRYKSDAEYEAHFLTLFKQSVERRTGAGAPILAELSGGMDSTAIVCMSDHLRRSADPSAEILDTVSFFDDSESSLNERTYFSITEANRGKVGIHIDTAFSQRSFESHDGTDGAYLLPGADSSWIEQERRFYDAVWQRGYRSILSGIGGDEVLGGNPTPLPELAGYLVSGNIVGLLRQSVAWSLIDRSPFLGTLYDTGKYVIDLYVHSESHDNTDPPWVSGPLRRRCGETGYGSSDLHSRLRMTPHCLDNSRAWWSVMETLPHIFPQILSRPEYRYPFLDKDLVSYLFSIPRDQVLRPGRRRSLMRRALVNTIPHEILERRRKAFQLRAPLRALQQAQPILESLFADSLLARAGFIDISKLRIALRSMAQGDCEWWGALLRTVDLELWLRASHYQSHRLSPEMEDARLPFSSIAQGRSSGSVY